MLKLGNRLKKFLPANQLAYLNGLDESGINELQPVIDLLEIQLQKIPKFYSAENVKANVKQVIAHFFIGSTDIYIIEYNEDTGELFTYTVLNSDFQNAEFGYSSLDEIQKNNFELDFYWEIKPLYKVNPLLEIPKIKNLLIGDEYFKQNPDNVLGVAQIKVRGDRGGKEEEVIKGTLKDALNKIQSNSVKEIPIDFNKKKKPTKKSKIDNITKAINNVSIDKSKEKALKYTDKTPILSLKDSYKLYNNQISPLELDAFLLSPPKHILNTIFSPTTQLSELISKGLLFYDLHGILVYRYHYLSGNVTDKLHELQLFEKDFSSKYGSGQFSKQIDELSNVQPLTKQVNSLNENDRILLLPHSEIAKSFLIDSVRDEFTRVRISEKTSLYDAFKSYLYYYVNSTELEPSSLEDVYKYIQNKSFVLKKDEKENLDAKQKADLKQVKETNAKKIGDILFTKFLSEALNDIDIQVLNSDWNRKFNGIVNADYNKIPVAFTFSKIFKKGAPLKLVPVQRNGVANYEHRGSLMLGYDVGVGKTLTAIACISNSIDTGRSKVPLLVVPDATYKKWKFEIVGGIGKSGKFEHGSAPHLKLKEFKNLNADFVYKEIKSYSESENK